MSPTVNEQPTWQCANCLSTVDQQLVNRRRYNAYHAGMNCHKSTYIYKPVVWLLGFYCFLWFNVVPIGKCIILIDMHQVFIIVCALIWRQLLFNNYSYNMNIQKECIPFVFSFFQDFKWLSLSSFAVVNLIFYVYLGSIFGVPHQQSQSWHSRWIRWSCCTPLILNAKWL